MKHAIASAAIVIGCGARGSAIAERPARAVLDPVELVGNWCDGQLCLRIDSTSYGSEWLVYSWTSEACQEGGFAQVDASGQILFGALNYGPGCFGSQASERYSIAFSIDGAELLARVSTTGQTLRLTAD